MQQIITTEEPWILKNKVPCAHNQPVATYYVRDNGIRDWACMPLCQHCQLLKTAATLPEFRTCCGNFAGTKSYDPYKNNMMAISANFQHIAAANTELKTYVEQLNQKIATLNHIIEINTEQLTQLRQEITQVNQHIESAETSIKTLVRKVASLIQFMPRFVQDASQWLTQLMLGEQIAAPNLAISWIEEHDLENP